ncbi:hypothetical protein [Iningainema tapete]|uniref:Uncharacterized protein n=1 Tax=Iningainema tapete BLCC-T55 TaxID=2748662 RepID=A0A8J6XR88_9CYAN|nr:hypothetical protein [Iningainema tapete]MBD2776890.1 hypothetical protein [Iningainema tapete BLCC-T55]
MGTVIAQNSKLENQSPVNIPAPNPEDANLYTLENKNLNQFKIVSSLTLA